MSMPELTIKQRTETGKQVAKRLRRDGAVPAVLYGGARPEPISVDPKADHDATMAKIQTVVDGYPGLYRDVLTYLKERIKEVLTGAGATIVVRVFGPDLAILREDRAYLEGLPDAPLPLARRTSEQRRIHGENVTRV